MKKIIFLLLCTNLISYVSRAQIDTLNLDFENYKTNKEPFIWNFNKASNDFSVFADTSIAFSAKASLKVEKLTSNTRASIAVYNYLKNDLIKKYKKITITCYVRYMNISKDGWPKIYINQQSEQSKYNTSTELLILPKDSISDWKQISLTVDIDTSVENFMFGLLTSTGTAWYDRMEIKLDDQILKDVPMASYPAQKEFEWLKNYATVIDTAKGNFLSSIKQDLNGVRVVGLGESTHGTHEFYKAKVDIIKDLVKNHGFNVIAMESPMAETHELNDYVINGKGNVRELINNRYLFSIHNTSEIENLLIWIKKENEKRQQKIYFEGVDMQKPVQALKNVVKYFGEIEELKANVKNLQLSFPTKRPYTYKNSLQQLVEIENYVNENDKFLFKKIPDYKWAKYNIDLLKQTLTKVLDSSGVISRDSLMCKNLIFLMDYYSKSKVIFWAHNGHVDNYSFSTGKHLIKNLGDRYYSIGFSTRQGGVRVFNYAKPKGEVAQIKKMYEGYLEFHLSQLFTDPFLLNLTKIERKESDKRKFMLNSLGLGILGFSSNTAVFYSKYELLKRFNALIFYDNTTATIINND